MIEEFSKFSNATIKNRFIMREIFNFFFVSLFRGFINPLLNTRFQTNPLNSFWFFISRRFVALFPLCRVEPFQVSLFPLFTRHSSFMRLWAPTYSSLLALLLSNKAFRKLSNRCPLPRSSVSGITLSFRFPPSFLHISYNFFRFNIITE